MKATVYFTRELTPQAVVTLYQKLGVQLPGKVAVKVHSGEKGNQNFLRPQFWQPMVEAVHGTIVECNTAYGDAAGGVRDNSEAHWKLLEEHGWTKYFDVDLMDAEGPDVVWPIPNGKVLKENHVGKNILRYDSMLVLAHFKGCLLYTSVPNIILEVESLSEKDLGYLIYFFEKACAISGYMLGVNPFNQPGVESYKKNMFALLGKPGYEAQKAELEAKLR